MSRSRRRLIVHGRVQGVFFRDSTRRHALALGLAGWVRNRRDGSVEVVFEGEPPAVAEGVEFCHQGPPMARVERVEVIAEAPQRVSGFEIRHG